MPNNEDLLHISSATLPHPYFSWSWEERVKGKVGEMGASVAWFVVVRERLLVAPVPFDVIVSIMIHYAHYSPLFYCRPNNGAPGIDHD